MRVVHIITRLIVGGAQENTLLTVEGQQRDFGDEVTLISGPALGPEGSLEARARSGAFDFRIIEEMRRNLHPMRDFRTYRKLIQILRELRPDIVHTHSSKAGILGRAAAKKLRLPVVHTIHGASFHYGQSPLAYRMYQAAERWAARKTDHFISVADEMTRAYVTANVAEADRFTTIYSGFDVEPFLNPGRSRRDVRAAWGIGEDTVLIGKIARLFPLKGHECVIEAAPTIIQKFPQVRFLFVGDGSRRGELEQKIAAAGLERHFVFTGLVSPQEIPELVHAMDIVVHASQWEGLARVLPQGLIAGKPVVSFDVGGAREVVIPGETGFLVERNDVKALGKALISLIEDPELRERLGRTGRTRWTERFRHQTMTRRIREVYQQVLECCSR